jgi:hypothetical protein
LIYLTYNDQASGIYKSQVIDVITYLSELGKKKVKLVSFIPWQTYAKNRTKIKRWYPNSLIVPIFPGISFWKIQLFIFWMINQFSGSSKIIARGPIACYFGLKVKKKRQLVIYDGRGAIKAEIEEFGYFKGSLAQKVIDMEKLAILKADFRIAVSQSLVDWWKSTYDYKSTNHSIIPCTASKRKLKTDIDDSFLRTDEVVLVYSGSTSPWQSFPLLIRKIEQWLANTNGKALFLSKENDELDKLVKKYPDRVLRKFVSEEEVHTYLCACDYGLLIRENTFTNHVSSPVKFAEYLRAGLKVIVSDKIGDYSELTKKESLGICINQNEDIPTDIPKITVDEKLRLVEYFEDKLELSAFREGYKKLI